MSPRHALACTLCLPDGACTAWRVWAVCIVAAMALSCRMHRPPVVTEGYVPVADGVRVYYRSVGEGPTTVVAAGLFIGDLLDPLARGRRLVLYHPRGRGRSDPGDLATVSVEQVASDLEALRVALRIEQMVLIGHSIQAKLAAIYAVRHPGRVTRLVQVGSAPPSPERPQLEPEVRSLAERTDGAAVADLERRLAAGEFGADSAEACRTLNALTLPAYFSDTTYARMVPDLCAHRNEWPGVGEPRFRALVATLPKGNWRDSVMRLEIPRLVIHGREDPVPFAGGRAWAAGDTNARLLAVSPAGHFPFLEQREHVMAALERFLDGEWPADAVMVPAETP